MVNRAPSPGTAWMSRRPACARTDFVDERQAEPEAARAAAGAAAAGEPLGERGVLRGVEALAVVGHGDVDPVRVTAHADHHPAAVRVLDGVVDQRPEGAAEGRGGSGDDPDTVLHPGVERRTGLLGVRAQAADEGLGSAPRVDRLARERVALQLRRQQQVPDHVTERRGVRDELVELAPLHLGDLVGEPPAQQLSPGLDDGQRRPELVARVGDEPSLQGERLRERPNGPAPDQQADGRSQRDTDDPASDGAPHQPRCSRACPARSYAATNCRPSRTAVA